MSKEKKASQVLAGVRAGITRKYNAEQRAIHGPNWKSDPKFKPWEVQDAVDKAIAAS